MNQSLPIASPATLNAPWWTASMYGQCREIDVTDIWQEQMDPENERGEVAMAYLWKDPRDDDDQYPTLRGISVSDGVAVYYDRLHAMNILGAAAIWHIEQHEWEA